MRGDVVGSRLNVIDAEAVSKFLVSSYTVDETYAKTVEVFNHRPNEFDFEAFMDEFKSQK